MSFKFTKSNLNFDVYAVASKPTAPGANNDIAIITSVPMPNWIMSPDKPSGTPRSDGDVWIQYSVNGDTFNALKNNTMMIATIKAWQYVDGAWVDVDAVSCQDGEWVEWIKYLFNYGNQSYEWQTRAWRYNSSGSGKEPTVTQNADGSVSLSLTAGSGQYLGGGYELAEDVDLTSVNTLELYGEYSQAFGNVNYCNVYLLVINRSTTYWGGNAVRQVYAYANTEFPISLDVSDLTGTYDVAVAMYSGGNAGSHTFKFEQLKMVE